MNAWKYLACLLAANLLLASAEASQVLYDPTKPPGKHANATTQSQRSLRLESVLVSKKRKAAIINGRRYKEGDRIGAGKVVSIQRRGVEIAMPDKTLSLRLRHVVVKRKTETDL
ncbi:MAG: hypothetical protein ACR2PS_12280 [Pseudomonadales bacterium]